MEESSSTSPGPEANPSADSWAEDAKTLLAEFGEDWQIARVPGDPFALICERTIGTETRIVAGTPRTCLDRIRMIPAEGFNNVKTLADPSKPAIVRPDAGGWISGAQL